MNSPVKLTRRAYLGTAIAAVATRSLWPAPDIGASFSPTPAYSVVPVVGDGKWIWTEPPEETGYLEPRDYELKIGIQLEGKGDAYQLTATTPVPADLPEQTINDMQVRTDGCDATVRTIAKEANQLVLTAPSIGANQVVAAAVTMRLTLRKQYLGHRGEQFTNTQPKLSKDFRKQYLANSPGIQMRLPEVKRIAADIASTSESPWERAKKCYDWVWENITARIGYFTSVKQALRDRVGDCEERAAVFVALCRALQIPARLVWVPNHNWAEFYLVDHKDTGHWIPAHTASYSWFGWTGAHELVIQKGDNLFVPEKRKPQRLLADWTQWSGAKPESRFLAELSPVASSPGEDPGPGARRKSERGEWVLQHRHPLDYHMRDGS